MSIITHNEPLASPTLVVPARKSTRFVSGPADPIACDVRPETVIHVGDLILLDKEEYAIPASDAPIAINHSVTKALIRFHKQFAGIAMDRSLAGETKIVRVATLGLYEIDIDGGLDAGDYVGPCFGDSFDFKNQSVRFERNRDLAIGKCVATSSGLLIDIFSVVMHGGPQ